MSNVKVFRASYRIWLSSLVLLLFAHGSAVCFAVSCHWMQEPKNMQETKQQEQEILFVKVSVKGADGQPVSGATVTPWALGGAMGTGLWSVEAVGGIEPASVMTDSQGIAKVGYPKFAMLNERVSTTKVTVSVNHPEHPYAGGERISVPLDKTHQFNFLAGAALEIKALINGEVDTSGQVYLMSTSGKPGETRPAKTAGGIIQVPPMAGGKGQLLLVRMNGQKPTHFSSIVDVDIGSAKGMHKQQEISLAPTVSVRGKFSDNVPRPIKNGRVQVSTIAPGESWNEISWATWSEVQANGTFCIESWPREQPIQLVALCDGFFAEASEKPPLVKGKPERGPYMRAQVFMKPVDSSVIVQMKPMVNCHVEVKDAFGKPVSDVVVRSYPNVVWWNGGSERYCSPLRRTAGWLATGKYESDSEAGEGLLAHPFQGKSDKQGRAPFQLPVGRFLLYATNDRYHLPIKVGSRSRRVKVRAGDSMDITLVVQPKGLEVLGDWEDLCGLVFG